MRRKTTSRSTALSPNHPTAGDATQKFTPWDGAAGDAPKAAGRAGAAAPVAVVRVSEPASRRRPKADDPEQDRPTQPGTHRVRLGAVAARRPRGSSGGDATRSDLLKQGGRSHDHRTVRVPNRPVTQLPGRALAQLPDYLAPGLGIVFVGINPGVQSARAGHYYANPRNPFWILLYKAGLTPRQLRPDEDHLLPTFGYGITDIVKRSSRGVADLTAADFRRGRRILEGKLLKCQPRIVCFNSKTGFVNFFGAAAFRRFGRQEVTISTSRVFVMPSTSPANAGTPVATKLRYLRALRRWRDTLIRWQCKISNRQ